MTVTTHHSADTVILRCHGRLVRGEESSLLCAAVQEHGKDVVIDLEGVTAIDAAGIGALVSLQAAGVYLKLMNPRAAVKEVLRLTGLEALFEISEPSAIGELLTPSVIEATDSQRGIPCSS
jgi:anti-anti-sigma factor